MITWFRRLVCRLQGHALVLLMTPERLAVMCPSCGYTSPGITWGREPSVKRIRDATQKGDGRGHSRYADAQ